MYVAFLITAFATLTQLSGSACFKFFITRDLNSAIVLAKPKWTLVEVTSTDESVIVKFDIPKNLTYSETLIFFANDTKAILQVNLGKTVQAKFYSAPYNVINKMEGAETTKDENDGFCQIYSSFPRAWLPEKCNKVSAAIVGLDGRYFNYYKLQNFQISLPDLMVIEEYMKIPDSVKN